MCDKYSLTSNARCSGWREALKCHRALEWALSGNFHAAIFKTEEHFCQQRRDFPHDNDLKTPKIKVLFVVTQFQCASCKGAKKKSSSCRTQQKLPFWLPAVFSGFFLWFTPQTELSFEHNIFGVIFYVDSPPFGPKHTKVVKKQCTLEYWHRRGEKLAEGLASVMNCCSAQNATELYLLSTLDQHGLMKTHMSKCKDLPKMFQTFKSKNHLRVSEVALSIPCTQFNKICLCALRCKSGLINKKNKRAFFITKLFFKRSVNVIRGWGWLKICLWFKVKDILRTNLTIHLKQGCCRRNSNMAANGSAEGNWTCIPQMKKKRFGLSVLKASGPSSEETRDKTKARNTEDLAFIRTDSNQIYCCKPMVNIYHVNSSMYGVVRLLPSERYGLCTHTARKYT